MKSLFFGIINLVKKIIIGIWDFFFFFFGMPYEEQASKLKLDEFDELITGPKNEKRNHQIFRANKVDGGGEV